MTGNPVVNTQILNLLIKMKNNGRTDTTIKTYDNLLKIISKHADLEQPEQVKQFIASLDRTNTYKRNLTKAYAQYCKHYEIKTELPKYEPDSKHIKIPTKEKLEMLIAAAGRTLSTRLQISMETGLRPTELRNLKVKDVDLKNRTIYPTTAKHGASRALRISNQLQATLQKHIIVNKLNPNDKLFKCNPQKYGDNYQELRNRLAQNLNDPSIRTIRLYDFRHYFATMLYHKTRNIILVKELMGHKRIETTMIYTQLLNLNEDEWNCTGTTNTEDAKKLIEAGFEYVTTTPDGTMLYRKRK